MKRAALILAALAAILTAAAAPVRTATENFVANKIAEANAALVATTHSAISSFASTGTVKKAKSANTATEATRATTATTATTATMAETADFAYNLYSLPDWTSWTVASLLNAATNAANHAVDVFSDNLAAVATSGKYSDLSGKPTNVSDFSNDAGYLTGYTETDPTVPQWAKAPTKPTYTASEVGATTPEDVTAAIREQSLGGIWDEAMQVWWTPRMRNGSLTYEATTNVNLNAEN